GTRHMDATSIWFANSPPMIFYNSALATDRLRFTLAHELGHLVMHDVPSETQEEEADLFASEFLMPENDIRPQFRRKLSLKVFASMKPYWKVSMAALVYKSHQLGELSDSQYRYYNIEL